MTTNQPAGMATLRNAHSRAWTDLETVTQLSFNREQSFRHTLYRLQAFIALFDDTANELAAARERIAALESIVKDTAKIGTYYHHAHRYYACPGCNGFVTWGDKTPLTPLEHDADCPIKAARTLLAEKVVECGGEGGGSEVGE